MQRQDITVYPPNERKLDYMYQMINNLYKGGDMYRQSLIKACESTILTTRVAVGTTLS